MKCFSSCAATVLFLVLVSEGALSQKTIPELWGVRIHDEANVLSQQTIETLEHQLAAYEDSTSNQIAVLIVQSLDNEVLEDYTFRVAEKWKLGQEGKDNGVLVFIAVNDQVIRIEVGYGLEGVLTDVQCNRIIRNDMAPMLRKDNFDGAVANATTAIIQSIGGEYRVDDNEGTNWDNVFQNMFYGFFLLLMVLFTVPALFSEGCFGWGVYFFLIPCYFILPWSVIGQTATLVILVVFVITIPTVRIVLSLNPKLKKKLEGLSFFGGGSLKGNSKGGSSKRYASVSRSKPSNLGIDKKFRELNISSEGLGESSNDRDSSESSSSGSDDDFSGGGGSFGGGGSSGRW
jgi:uncharacterized protein